MTSTTKRLVFLGARRWLAGCVLLLIAVFTLLAYQDESAYTRPDTEWLYVQPQVLESQIGLVGRIEAATRLTLAAPFEGLVRNVSVTEGQLAERGQRLLELDTTQLDIQIREALADQLKARRTVQNMQNWEQSEEVSRARRAVTSARLNLDDTEAKLADTHRLFKRGIVARMDVDSLVQQAKTQRLDLMASQAELRAALARGKGENLQIAEMELANAQARYQALLDLHAQRYISAPFAGIVLPPQRQEGSGTSLPIQAGMRVAPSSPLYELASLERINAVARIEEADLHQVEEGMSVQITGDGFDGISLKGHIASIGVQGIPSSVYGGGTNYEIIVAIEKLTSQQRQRVRLGMSAKLSITTYRVESGLAVPAEAIQRTEEGGMVINYREKMNEAPIALTVTTGRAVPNGVEVFGISSGYVELPSSFALRKID